jgi:hypothetical protein
VGAGAESKPTTIHKKKLLEKLLAVLESEVARQLAVAGACTCPIPCPYHAGRSYGVMDAMFSLDEPHVAER